MIIGLTGGIACGKTTVANILKEEAFCLFDCDSFCAELYSTKNTLFSEKIKERWGRDFLNNNIPDKKKIADLIFSDKNEKKWLESIIHPIVLEAMTNYIKSNKNVVCEVPLLYEVNWSSRFDKIISVWAPKNLVINHLISRGLSMNEIILRLESQMPPEKKLEMADFGVINSSSFDNLKIQCKKILKYLKK
ncbi:MAG TPA: dephospho-CoA kinase [Victivallales bacterium]|nr:dephospho-CoA kinase [Victivallales bacterium]HRR06749.1 dephospho-CoA kinase [Victivallales bacterium]HRR28458.1 dephospho-CoA kinase [Victivallales bacterium]HRU01308.1 dephospho-CoA kinase [Victivallales bacterium]